MIDLGLYPTHLWRLAALLVPILLWLALLQIARNRHVMIWHHSSLAVSYWEELLFRGLIWGLILIVWDSQLLALILSSVLFGLFHLRNLWWASHKRVLFICLYTGLLFAPIVGLVRWWSGDIYLCIAIHALHNFGNMYLSRSSSVPTDEYLRSRQHRMNWFERAFSVIWVESLLRRLAGR